MLKHCFKNIASYEIHCNWATLTSIQVHCGLIEQKDENLQKSIKVGF